MQGHPSVAIEFVCLSAKSSSIALENKSAINSDYGSESNCENESKKGDESLHEAYEKMYA